MKRWMKIVLSKNAILLHHNEELEQYKDLPRMPESIMKKIISVSKNKQKKVSK